MCVCVSYLFPSLAVALVTENVPLNSQLGHSTIVQVLQGHLHKIDLFSCENTPHPLYSTHTHTEN